jgi:hypothetical protein
MMNAQIQTSMAVNMSVLIPWVDIHANVELDLSYIQMKNVVKVCLFYVLLI